MIFLMVFLIIPPYSLENIFGFRVLTHLMFYHIFKYRSQSALMSIASICCGVKYLWKNEAFHPLNTGHATQWQTSAMWTAPHRAVSVRLQYLSGAVSIFLGKNRTADCSALIRDTSKLSFSINHLILQLKHIKVLEVKSVKYESFHG